MRAEQQSGVVLMAVVIILLPVVIAVGAFTAAMTSRTNRLADEVNQEKALMAAESGIDLAIWIGAIGYLQNDQHFGYYLSQDTRCLVSTRHLRADGIDNDGDGITDEADEDVFQVVSEGHYRGTVRNVAAYLGPVPPPPLVLPGAVTVTNPDIVLDLNGTPMFTGFDTNLDGTRGNPASDVPGLAISPPGTIADLLDELTGREGDLISGLGGTPSVAVAPPLDVTALVNAVQNSANNVLTNSRYSDYSFGSGASGVTTITYRDGDVKFSGNCTGAGIMVITGDAEFTGDFRFDGIVVVLGNVRQIGTAQIYGAFVSGPSGEEIWTRGTFDVRYSAEALSLVNLISGRYVAFNGWQELAR